MELLLSRSKLVGSRLRRSVRILVAQQNSGTLGVPPSSGSRRVMTLQDLGAIGEIVGSIGVVISLIYLAIQLRHNTTGIRLAAHQHVVIANSAVTMAPANNLDFASLLWRGVLSSKNLDEDTQVAFGLWCHQYFSMIQAWHQLYLAGAIDEGIWDRELQRAVGALRVPGFREWWDAGGRSQLSPTFVRLAETTPLNIQAVGWNKDQGFVPAEWTRGDT